MSSLHGKLVRVSHDLATWDGSMAEEQAHLLLGKILGSNLVIEPAPLIGLQMTAAS